MRKQVLLTIVLISVVSLSIAVLLFNKNQFTSESIDESANDIPQITLKTGTYYPENNDFNCSIKITDTDIEFVGTDEDFQALYTYNNTSYLEERLQRDTEYWKVPHEYKIFIYEYSAHLAWKWDWSEVNNKYVMSSGGTILDDETIHFYNAVFRYAEKSADESENTESMK